MDDDSFKTELLNKLDRIQTLLSYLCGAAKASEERVQAELAKKQRSGTEPADTPEETMRSLLQDEMQDDYDQAVRKWKSDKF